MRQQGKPAGSTGASDGDLCGSTAACRRRRLPPPANTPHPRAALQEQALKKAADLQQTAALSAKEGLAGARLIGADLASGNAKRAGTRLSGFLSSASGSAGMLYLARLLVRATGGGWPSKVLALAAHFAALASCWQQPNCFASAAPTSLGLAPAPPSTPPPLCQVCCYFLNAIYEKVESYQFLQQPEVLERARRVREVL